MKTHPYSPDPLKLLLLALAAMLPVAHADISGVHTRATISATAQVAINPTLTTPDLNPVRDDKRPPDQFDVLSFNQNLLTNAAKEGLSARGGSQQSTTLTSIANSLSFSSSASTVSAATRTGDPLKDTFTGGAGSASFSVTFTVDGRSTFSLSGSANVETNGATESSESEIELSGQTTDGEEVDFDFKAKDGRRDPRSINASKSGILKPGTYTLSVFTLSTIAKTQPTSRSSYNCTFSVSSFPVPPQPPVTKEIRWTRAAGGSFSTANNWSPAQVPVKTTTEEDTAIFALASSYTVSILAGQGLRQLLAPPLGSAHTDKMIVSNGEVSLLSASYTVDALALDEPSLLIKGRGTLRITEGVLSARHAVIGDAGSRGDLIVGTIDARLQTTGRLAIGRGGVGVLQISGGGTVIAAESVIGAGESGTAFVTGHQSEWQTGNFAVGLSSGATFTILDGGRVTSDEAFMAFGVTQPLVIVDGRVEGVNATDGRSSKWTMTRLKIGQSGFANLEINKGGEVDATNSVQLGTTATGDGSLVVDGRGGVPEHSSTLTVGINLIVGAGGTGDVEISSGGFVLSNDKVSIGAASTGSVRLRLGLIGASESQLTALGEMHIGEGGGGRGLLTLEPFTNVSANSAKVGLERGIGVVVIVGNPFGPEDTKFRVTNNLSVGGSGVGVIVLRNGLLEVGGSIDLNTNGTIQGTGKVRVAGDLHANGGFITPGLSPGLLTLEGNLVLEAGAVINSEVAGPTPGTQADQLIVTGNATLNGTLKLQFMNGYAPKAGAAFPFFKVSGATTGDFAAIDVLGLAPGAQFQTALSNGVYTATAMNDTAALPTVSIRAVTKRAFEKGKRGVAFLVSRKGSRASKANPLTVSYTIGGTAENGIDYTLLPGSVTIPARRNAVLIKLKPFDDSEVEGRETVELTVIPGADYTHTLRSKARAAIIDNDRAVR